MREAELQSDDYATAHRPPFTLHSPGRSS